jgi:hypothetical protein
MSETQSHDDRAMLREYLAARDVPCPLCNYNLHALEGSACPECGHVLVLKLDLADPVRGAYLAGLIGLSLSAGFNAIASAIILLIEGPQGAKHDGIAYFVSMAFVSFGLLAFWMYRSKAIRRQTKSHRILYALLCWLLPTLSIAIPTGFLRLLQYYGH